MFFWDIAALANKRWCFSKQTARTCCFSLGFAFSINALMLAKASQIPMPYTLTHGPRRQAARTKARQVDPGGGGGAK